MSGPTIATLSNGIVSGDMDSVMEAAASGNSNVKAVIGQAILFSGFCPAVEVLMLLIMTFYVCIIKSCSVQFTHALLVDCRVRQGFRGRTY